MATSLDSYSGSSLAKYASYAFTSMSASRSFGFAIVTTIIQPAP